jgi:hypothetical protein
MSEPLTIDVPHTLGRAAARERLRTRAGDLVSQIPGGVAEVKSSWIGEDEMALEITAMNQTIAARLDVQDTLVRVHLTLPAMLSFFSGMIGSAVREGGTRMLEDKSA